MFTTNFKIAKKKKNIFGDSDKFTYAPFPGNFALLSMAGHCVGSEVLRPSRVSHRVSRMIQGDAHIVFLASGKNGAFQKGS